MHHPNGLALPIGAPKQLNTTSYTNSTKNRTAPYQTSEHIDAACTQAGSAEEIEPRTGAAAARSPALRRRPEVFPAACAQRGGEDGLERARAWGGQGGAPEASRSSTSQEADDHEARAKLVLRRSAARVSQQPAQGWRGASGRARSGQGGSPCRQAEAYASLAIRMAAGAAWQPSYKPRQGPFRGQ